MNDDTEALQIYQQLPPELRLMALAFLKVLANSADS